MTWNEQTVAVTLILLLVVLAGTVRVQFSALQVRIAALSRLEAKVDLLLKHSGIKFDPYANLPQDITDAVRAGRKIEAIKLYRQSHGCSLKEAKDVIEEVQRRAGRA
jgi:hypothetical protein